MQTQEIQEIQRTNFKSFMKNHSLTASSWAKKSGVAEATIRHYINGRNKSITASNIEKLAKAIGVESDVILNGYSKDKTYIKIQKDLFIKCFVDLNNFITELDLKIDPVNYAEAILIWYELVMMENNHEEKSNLSSLKGLVMRLSSK